MCYCIYFLIKKICYCHIHKDARKKGKGHHQIILFLLENDYSPITLGAPIYEVKMSIKAYQKNEKKKKKDGN